MESWIGDPRLTVPVRDSHSVTACLRWCRLVLGLGILVLLVMAASECHPDFLSPHAACLRWPREWRWVVGPGSTPPGHRRDLVSGSRRPGGTWGQLL